MLFDSEEAAKNYYDEYAGRVGFATRFLSSCRSERDGSIISRGLGCSNRGSDSRKEVGVPTQKRDRPGGCTAMILVKRENLGRWVVKKFVQAHNHSLSVSLCQRRPTIYNERDKRIQELTAELRVKKRLTSAYKEQLLSLVKDIESQNEHISAKVQVANKYLKELEAQRQQLLQRR